MRAALAALVAAALGVALLGAAAAAGEASGTLRLHAVFHVGWKAVACPRGTPTTTSCYLNVGSVAIPAIGKMREQYVLLVEHSDTNCADWRFRVVLTVAGKGSIAAEAFRPGCFSPYAQSGTSRYRITGGSGVYRKASGSGKIVSTGSETGPGYGIGTDTWTGTLTVPGRRLTVAGTTGHNDGTLQLRAVFGAKWQGADCPPGSANLAVCYATVGQGRAPGLGEVTETYVAVVDDQAAKCIYPHFTGTFTVAGKGEIDFSARSPDCVPPLQPSGAADYVVTGGSGAYAGATGSGREVSIAHETGYAHGIATDTWTGSLTVPNLTFDVAAPVIQGARNLTVKARPGAKRATVRYALAATDDADGAVPVVCRPRSGSRFRIGRTRVTCSAADASGNVASTAFSVTVRAGPATRALSSTASASGELSLSASFPVKDFAATCPPGTPSTTECFAFESSAPVPGLGVVTEKYLAFDDQSDSNCRHTSWSPVVLTIAGKGEIDAALAPVGDCDGRGQFIGAGSFTITGGSGSYSGASGSGTQNAGNFVSDVWAGTLSVPGLTFDTTRPVLKGAKKRTVGVRAGVKRVRVRFTVTAADAVDGPLPVGCRPRSGSWFRPGRTIVSCSATDSSANETTGSFAVLVKRG